MDNLQELIPFAKEMLSQKPSRGLLKVYLVGSVFAVLGTAIECTFKYIILKGILHPFAFDLLNLTSAILLGSYANRLYGES
uniref:Uncharacterized protein n=1 Tax=Labrus bergylta TaxID=56723 RepID=A0A3Q3FZA1_9LABR